MGYVVWMDHHHSKYIKGRCGNGSLYIHDIQLWKPIVWGMTSLGRSSS